MVQKVLAEITSKVLMAAHLAFSSATGAAIAAAWAPAAAMVSLASWGSNAAPAMAGMAATRVAAQALAIPFAEGGIVDRPTLALIGEKGKEAVIPFDKMGGVTNINISINANIDSQMDIGILAEDLGFEIERRLSRAKTIG